MAGARVRDDPGGEAYRVAGVGHADEERIADRLDFFGVVVLEQGAHAGEEPGGDVGSVLVAVGLGQCGVARQVGEDESLLPPVALLAVHLLMIACPPA